MNAGYQCAACGTWNEILIDSSAGAQQSYIEDCQICCKPNALNITWDISTGKYKVRAELE